MSVYLVQERKRYNKITKEFEPVINLSHAAEYGQLVELFSHNDHALLVQPTVRKLKQTLRNFSDDDYLLPIGDPVLIGISTAIAAEANGGRVKMLHWDRELKKYIVLNYDLRGQMNGWSNSK